MLVLVRWMIELLSTAVSKIVELKGIAEEVVVNQRRCRTLSNRLLSVNPVIEVFKKMILANADESDKALAQTICTLADEIGKYVGKFRLYEGLGPMIKGQSVCDFAIKAFTRGEP